MIVLGEKIENVNILHVILGPETDFHFDLNGRSEMDITEYCSNMSPGDKCMLLINKCSSEQAVVEMLQYRQEQMKAMEQMKNIAENMGNTNSSSNTSSTSTISKTPEKKQVSNVKCPKCLEPNSAIIVDGYVQPCATCQKIDSGLKTIPPVPSNDKLNEIKKEVENKNEKQKKSNFKFFKNNPPKKE